jgi:ribonuclease HI
VLKAEALASLHAVKFCQELGISCIVLEGDAILIVLGINSSSTNWSKYGHVIWEIRTVL